MTERVIGHEATIAPIMTAIEHGTLPRALLLGGPRGIGKASVATFLTQQLLSREGMGQDLLGDGIDEVVHTQIAAGTHPDLFLASSDRSEEGKHSEINIERIREANHFLTLTPSASQWRIVIIDAAEDMNVNAANALLKTLEEPPSHGLMILVSHRPARLLPTIRSRCRQLRFMPLSTSHYEQVMDRIAPELAADERALYARLTQHSPGQTLQYHHLQAGDAYALLLDSLPRALAGDAVDIAPLISWLGKSDAHAKWPLLGELLLGLIAAMNHDDATLNEKERSVLSQMRALKSPAAWADDWFDISQLFRQAASLHFDYKTVLTTLFASFGRRATAISA